MRDLSGLHVLIVEDEPVVAMSLEDILEELGCIPVGPASRLSEGLALAAGAVDAAILDINLAGERSTAIAELLQARDVPFAFASGYGAPPDGFDVPMIEKPYRAADIERMLQVILAG
ncbi:response regulator [Sphingomonas soli]|uniref:response regulator n=1 Tax=Sphingomonas soli TaxID=266127 RepID=UPI000A000168|nr:response regulator [Sphingomonas soli]